MSKPVRSSAPAIARLPRQIDGEAHYLVRYPNGRTIRCGPLEPGTDLWARLRDIHDEYARRGYSVGKLRNGQWSFPAVKGHQRITIAIQLGIPAAISSVLDAASTEPLGQDKATMQ